jgi:hypothetical protein
MKIILSHLKLYGRVVVVISTLFIITSCAVKHPPSPVYGVDIKAVAVGEPAPFKGTLFSDFYLNRYLQWKDTK